VLLECLPNARRARQYKQNMLIVSKRNAVYWILVSIAQVQLVKLHLSYPDGRGDALRLLEMRC
jgi:hypothetical protein